jgi:hypothetical protein
VIDRRANHLEHPAGMTPNARGEVSVLVLIHERLDGFVCLTALDLAELTPEKRNDGHGLEPTAGHTLVHVTTFGTDDPAKPAHGLLEPDQDRWHASAVSGLRNNCLETQIARPRFVLVNDRAALAIEEACGPGQFKRIEDHSEQGCGHGRLQLRHVAHLAG